MEVVKNNSECLQLFFIQIHLAIHGMHFCNIIYDMILSYLNNIIYNQIFIQINNIDSFIVINPNTGRDSRTRTVLRSNRRVTPVAGEGRELEGVVWYMDGLRGPRRARWPDAPPATRREIIVQTNTFLSFPEKPPAAAWLANKIIAPSNSRAPPPAGRIIDGDAPGSTTPRRQDGRVRTSCRPARVLQNRIIVTRRSVGAHVTASVRQRLILSG